MSSDSHLQPSASYPRHLQSQYFSREPAVFNHRLSAVLPEYIHVLQIVAVHCEG
jgi:hypothetical protein